METIKIIKYTLRSNIRYMGYGYNYSMIFRELKELTYIVHETTKF